MRTAIILQARLGSSRLPEKVIKPILNRPMIELQLERLLRVKEAQEVILATTNNPKDDILCDIANSLNINFFRGSEHDVLDRFYGAANAYKVNHVVRCNADCPLIDPLVVDTVIRHYKVNYPKFDYVSNILKPSYPIGMHTEIFSFGTLSDANSNSIDPLEREHVTPYIYRRPNLYSIYNVCDVRDRSGYRLTVDYEIDFEVIKKIYESLYPSNSMFGMNEIIDYLDNHPEIRNLNSHIEKSSTV